ncbi:MAG: nickel-dependent lactate racemase [bacterium]
MKYYFGYGKTEKNVDISDKNIISIIKPKNTKFNVNEKEEVIRAIKSPIGTKTIKDLIFPNEKVAIITSDITRPVSSDIIIPILLNELYKIGIEKKDITIVFALGIHRKHTKEEMIKLVGEDVFKEIKCIDSDTVNTVNLGYTKLGTPVSIDFNVVNADKRICIGNIEYHYFAGYSGGAKAIMPGVSTRKAVQTNHSKMISPFAYSGNIINNPVRLDLENAIEFCSIDFIINVILDENKKIIKAVAGDHIKAHRVGCDFLDKIFKIEIKEKADIVIVSQGGSPKDINLYQTQKALDNSKYAVKDNGVVILVGACNEGMGENIFEEWMVKAKKPEDLIKLGFESEFVGRVPVFITLNELSEESFYKILTNEYSSIVNSKKRDFESYGITLEFEEEALRTISKMATREKTGARALVRIIENTLIQFERLLPSTSIDNFKVTQKIVEDPKNAINDYIKKFNLDKIIDEMIINYGLEINVNKE